MLRPLLPLFVVVTAFAGTASAHHSQAGLFDSSKTIEITGVVKAISWRNPHGHITLAVTDDKGKVVDWDAETASISVLRNRGVDAEGDHQRRRHDHDRGCDAAPRRSGDARDERAARERLRVHVRLGQGVLSGGQGRQDFRTRGHRRERRARASHGGRVVPGVEHDHERPGGIPYFQGRLSAHGRGQGGARAVEPAR